MTIQRRKRTFRRVLARWRAKWGGGRSGVARRPRRSRPVFYEALEPRVLLTAEVVNGVLLIEGSSLGDTIEVREGDQLGDLVLTGVPGVEDGSIFQGVVSIEIDTQDGDDSLTLDNLTTVRDINVAAGAGDDTLVLEDGATLEQGEFDGSDGFDVVDMSRFTTPINGMLQFGTGDLTNTGGVSRVERVLGGSGGNVIVGGDLLDLSGADSAVTVNLKSLTARFNRQTVKLENAVQNVIASPFNDRLTGNVNNNFIDGGDGNDSITGGGGNDTLVGGPGRDRLKAEDGASDLFGEEGDDQLSAKGGSHRMFGGDGNDKLTAPRGPGSLLDGGAGDDTLKGTNEFGSDILQGGPGNDKLTGGRGNNTLDGGDGDDVLKVSRGFNTLIGGPGNDKLNGSRDPDVLDGGPGDDVIKSGSNRRANDTLIGGPGNDKLSAGRGNDSLDGGDGDDDINAGSGDDLIFGSLGDDRLNPGGGNNVLSYANLQVGITINLAQNTVSGPGISGRLSGFDRIIATPFDDVLVGSGGSDRLEGGEGNDVIRGGGGGDVLLGQEGDDTIDGEGGNDVISGGPGVNTLMGGAGTDEIQTDSAENGTIDGGDGRDTAVIITSGDGETIDVTDNAGQLQVTRQGDAAFTVDVDNVEDLTLDAADGDDTITINDLAGVLALRSVTILGSTGNDTLDARPNLFSGVTLDGGAGDDLLLGGMADDNLLGAAGNDTFIPGGGNNLLEGGGGTDTVDYSDANGVVGSIGSNGTITNNQLGARDRIRDVTVLIGSPGADDVSGSSLDEVFFGGGGNDTLRGGGGSDVIRGEDGNDFLQGGPGADQLFGGAGLDELDSDNQDTVVDPGEDN